ncbi:biotin-dependent carboxylase-like uncharacterized protein [Rhodobacter aestuarii]|uniref:Biotin-dependent carboxylase uncharacterized domain-containing protein n=1 Tax=Rhodobacter aestuarii TaxID=453582 RepID=A0A1N7M3L9_9RHOB|nr:biotin-dependent carboxyltransferase family protein [Rhodobacter aestuarii]PTV94823.1 biotin-dependent carboxylase-like uncharacterized protein [Rhodobacter aestuarii]SIS80677.1 biotin-dependent carboxylase uncharacterized domain-containing protein [Rhodobacter aestuarii]
MTNALEVLAVTSQITVQDLGRPGFTALGLSIGGAADRRALWEAAALLDHTTPQACLEMPLTGGRFRATCPTRIALTGAPMRASLAGRALLWNASHTLAPGEVLEIGPAEAGIYGYISFAGGIATPLQLGARATLASAGLGTVVNAGMCLPLGPDPAPDTPAQRLPLEPRFQGGILRVMPGPQTELFDAATRTRAFATPFRAGAGSRQGVALTHEGAPFASQTAGLLSDFITPGDVQTTGSGQPTILLADCQSIGGYPRLGTVIPADLPIAAQARPGTALRLAPVTLAEAEALSPEEPALLAQLRKALQPLIRDPHDIADLLSYQLISGVVRGDEEDL